MSNHNWAQGMTKLQADLLEQTHDAVFMWELDGKIIYWNRGAELLYGWSKEEAVGCITHELLKTVHPFAVEELERNLRSDGYWEGELVHHARDGRRVIVESRHVLARHNNGESGFVLETNQDITERRRAEEALHEVREAERHRIARDLHDESLQDLIQALQQLRATRTKVKNPELKTELQREISALKRALAGLRSAIYDLRLDTDQEQTFVEMLDLLVDLARQRSPEREVELLIEEDFSSPLSYTTQVELVRIVQEALANIQRHSHARHVRVTIGASGDKLWVEVEDDGRGIDPSETATGMGIKGMRERARALGGDLKIESKLGQGTKVRFEAKYESDGQVPDGETARILLVEDHTSIRQALASVFEQEPGFEVVGQAGSLAEARKILDGVDVAIVDLGLPDGYGGELIKELRATNPQAQALVLSASLNRAQIARAVENGAAGILHKSVEMSEVVESVRRVRAGESLLPLEEVVELLRFAGYRREQEYEASRAIAELTPREKEVLQLLAEGLDSQKIAERLYISAGTERNHMIKIFAKLGVHSRLQALVFAIRHGVVEIDSSLA